MVTASAQGQQGQGQVPVTMQGARGSGASSPEASLLPFLSLDKEAKARQPTLQRWETGTRSAPSLKRQTFAWLLAMTHQLGPWSRGQGENGFSSGGQAESISSPCQ